MDFGDVLAGWIDRRGIRRPDDFMTEGAQHRATLAWVQFAGSEEVALPNDRLSSEGLAFTVAHTLGEAAALKRAAIALSDPRARGNALAVVQALADGCDIEDALRKASAKQERGEPQAVVVPFRRLDETT